MVESVDSACMHATGAINHDLVHLHREHIDGFPSPSLTHLVTLSKTTRLRVNVTDSLQPILRGIIPPHESQRGARARRWSRDRRRQHKVAAAAIVDSLKAG